MTKHLVALLMIALASPAFAEGGRPKGFFLGLEREMKEETEFNRFFLGKKTKWDIGDNLTLKNKTTVDFKSLTKDMQFETERLEVDFSADFNKTGVEFYVKNRLEPDFDWQRTIVGVEVEF